MPDPTRPLGHILSDPHAEAERVRRLPPIMLEVGWEGEQVHLEEPCPRCDGAGGIPANHLDPAEPCDTCETTGVALTENGAALLDFLRRWTANAAGTAAAQPVVLPGRFNNRDRHRQIGETVAADLMSAYHKHDATGTGHAHTGGGDCHTHKWEEEAVTGRDSDQ